MRVKGGLNDKKYNETRNATRERDKWISHDYGMRGSEQINLVAIKILRDGNRGGVRVWQRVQEA